MNDNPVNQKKLVHDLRSLGVQPGDTLFVHSSFKSLGPVVGGAETVIGALLEALGPEGTLLMPSFNLCSRDQEERAKRWDPATTPSTVGWLTEYFRSRPGTLRSDHYSHSVAAFGAHAREYVEGHRRQEGYPSPWDRAPWGYTYGTQSPFVKAWKDPRGRLLMLGVDYHSATFCHLVEVLYWDQRRRQNPNAPYLFLMREEAGSWWDAQGRLRRGQVGNAACRLFSIRAFVDGLLAAVTIEPARFCKGYSESPS